MKQADMRTRTDFCAKIYSSNKRLLLNLNILTYVLVEGTPIV